MGKRNVVREIRRATRRLEGFGYKVALGKIFVNPKLSKLKKYK